jgi:hypothetical protein
MELLAEFPYDDAVRWEMMQNENNENHYVSRIVSFQVGMTKRKLASSRCKISSDTPMAGLGDI